MAFSIFKDRASFESWSLIAPRAVSDMTALTRPSETVYYEGTLVISSGKFFVVYSSILTEYAARFELTVNVTHF